METGTLSVHYFRSRIICVTYSYLLAKFRLGFRPQFVAQLMKSYRTISTNPSNTLIPINVCPECVWGQHVEPNFKTFRQLLVTGQTAYKRVRKEEVESRQQFVGLKVLQPLIIPCLFALGTADRLQLCRWICNSRLYCWQRDWSSSVSIYNSSFNSNSNSNCYLEREVVQKWLRFLAFWLPQTLWRIWIMGSVLSLVRESSHILWVCTLALALASIVIATAFAICHCRLVDHGKRSFKTSRVLNRARNASANSLDSLLLFDEISFFSCCLLFIMLHIFRN